MSGCQRLRISESEVEGGDGVAGRCNIGIKVEEQLRGTGFFLE